MPTRIYATGAFYTSACTDETDEATTAVVNAAIEHHVPWVISRRPFADGSPNPTDCNCAPTPLPGHRHVLLTVLNEPEASPVPALVDA